MRISVLCVLSGLIAGCTTGAVTVPRDQILYEVPSSPARAAPQTGFTQGEPRPTDDFTGRIEAALAEPAEGAAAAGGAGTAGANAQIVTPRIEGSPLNDDHLNLNQYTLEQQRIDAAIAERELAAAREQLVIVTPGETVPEVRGVNVALFASQTTHAVGEKRYSRSINPFRSRGRCARYPSPDAAQRAFLAEGGPERDPLNLDPDGDGFACGWDPEPYRRLVQ